MIMVGEMQFGMEMISTIKSDDLLIVSGIRILR